MPCFLSFSTAGSANGRSSSRRSIKIQSPGKKQHDAIVPQRDKSTKGNDKQLGYVFLIIVSNSSGVVKA